MILNMSSAATEDQINHIVDRIKELLPTFRAATDSVISLVQLLTGHQVDASDGIAPLEKSAFLDAPEDYRRAWLSWRGLGDDPTVSSSAQGEKTEGRRSAMSSRD